MGVRLDDKQLIKALRNCSTPGGKCEECPMYNSDPATPEDSLGCTDDLALLAADRLEALTSGATDIPTFVKSVPTNLIHFVEPMRIPTTTQQEHGIGRRKNGKGYIYDTAEIKAARQTFRAHFAKYRPDKPIEGAVVLSVSWYFLDEEKKHEDREPKITPPDTDNLVKILKDELARLGFYTNDAHVALEISEKMWSHDFEGIRIVMTEIYPRRQT